MKTMITVRNVPEHNDKSGIYLNPRGDFEEIRDNEGQLELTM